MLRRHSFHRRPSFSIASASASDRSGGSLRHVGEGALDDSDSSGSSGENEKKGDASSDEESNSIQPLISPQVWPTGNVPAHPSPLSNVAGQQLVDDEGQREDESSPSPRSTDTESSSYGFPPPRPKSLRRNSGRMKSRSRSSTVASLAAGVINRHLTKKDSHSSIGTVVAAEPSFREENQSKDVSQAAPVSSHTRQRSQGVLSEFMLVPEERSEEKEVVPAQPASQLSDRRPDIVRAEENRFRELGWDILRKQLNFFADEVLQQSAFTALKLMIVDH
jgi:WD repeat-containing protein 24